MAATGPRNFYKSSYQYAKLDIKIPLKTVPENYAIKIVIGGGTMSSGTAFSNFESLNYTAIYSYDTTSITIKGMGSILVGSIISTTFQFYKDSVTTSFYFDVYIDT